VSSDLPRHRIILGCMTPPKNVSVVTSAASIVVLIVAAFPSLSLASPLRFGPHDCTSLFTISKSENKNEVVFAIHLDEHCAPIGDAPVFSFWRMYEKGPQVIEPLLSREQAAYGIAGQTVLSIGSDGGRVQITLRALPKRPVVIETKPGDGRCEAWSTVDVAGESAYLYNVYAKLKTFGVDYLLLSGWALDRARVLHEKVAR
jgi:hypothetical protein